MSLYSTLECFHRRSDALTNNADNDAITASSRQQPAIFQRHIDKSSVSTMKSHPRF